MLDLQRILVGLTNWLVDRLLLAIDCGKPTHLPRCDATIRIPGGASQMAIAQWTALASTIAPQNTDGAAVSLVAMRS